MARTEYSPQFKTKLVLEVLCGEKELGSIACEMGWELPDTLETAPVLDAVRNAVERFRTPAILNSGQGSQFTSSEYKTLLKTLGIRQSMDGKSRWAGNIMIER